MGLLHSVYNKIYSYFSPPTPEELSGKTPLTPSVRLKNLVTVHYRGLFGLLSPLLIVIFFTNMPKDTTIVACLWMTMFWAFIFQPTSVPSLCLLPVFVFPLSGVLSSDRTCEAYMKEGTVLFFMGSMLGLLWNNSGFDRRVALWFLRGGDASQFSAKRLVFKCGCAGFWLSMFSNRLLVTAILTEYMTKILGDLENSTKQGKFDEPCYKSLAYVVNNAIQSSSTIGSIGIIHSSYPILIFRVLFHESALDHMMWPDVFNYLEYSSFAFPVACVMFLGNIMYYIRLVNKTGKPMSPSSMSAVRDALKTYRKEIPKKMSLHEGLTVFFSVLSLLVFFFRWTKYFHGWSEFRSSPKKLPAIEDASVACFFVILLHSLPCSFRFLKIFYAKKMSQLGPNKPESGILWWRFVDKNVNYGYIFLMGAGVSLMFAIRHSNLNQYLSNGPLGKLFTDLPWPASLLLVVVISVILPNIMTSSAATVIFLPFVMNINQFKETFALRSSEKNPWVQNIFIAGLGSGIGTSLGFTFPFLYTPAYFTHHIGKVPMRIMVKYGIGSMIICTFILWLSITYYAPILWDANEVILVDAHTKKPTVKTTTQPL